MPRYLNYQLDGNKENFVGHWDIYCAGKVNIRTKVSVIYYKQSGVPRCPMINYGARASVASIINKTDRFSVWDILFHRVRIWNILFECNAFCRVNTLSSHEDPLFDKYTSTLPKHQFPFLDNAS